MARRTIPLDEKIEKAQATVMSAKAKYEDALNDLERLMTRKRELESKELIKAFAASDRSYEEVMAFLKSTPKNESTD